MHCPVCKNYSLVVNEPEEGLTAQLCSHCQGRWIGSFQYWKWKEASGKSLPEMPADASDALPVQDSKKAKLCPECGHFLRQYPVGHDIAFGLDRCGNCGGTWFDQNEWETLKSRNLHDDVHKIFSEIWQSQVRDEEHQQAMTVFYQKKFGEADYQTILEMKKWIVNHPHQVELRAFLLS